MSRTLRTTRAAALAVALLLGSATAEAAIERSVEVQGVLETGSGVPANGTFDLVLKIYADATTTTVLHTTTLTDVVVAAGLFDATVGPLPLSALSLDQLWLEVTVEGTALPRRPMRATPFALVAQTAREAATVSCTGCLTGAMIANGTIAPADVGAGTYAISISGNAASASIASDAVSAASFTGPLAGDVTGTQGATTVGAIRGRAVATTAPTDQQVLKYDAGAGQWKPAADQSGAGTVTSVGTGAGLGGGPITGAGTIQLRLATGGGLAVNLGDGSQLGIAAQGVTPAMVGAGTYNISVSGNAATATTAAGFSGSLAGDVSGGQGATSVVKLRGVAVSPTAPSNGQVLAFNGSTAQWAPTTPAAGVSALQAGTGVAIGGSASVPQVSVLYGTTAGTAAQGNDARLSDARAPTAGSAHYVQNQTGGAQSASFRISGDALVHGKIGAGTASPQATLDVAGTFRLNGQLVSTLKVVAQGHPGPYRGDVGIYKDGVLVHGNQRSYNLAVFRRSDHALVYHGGYDVYGNAAEATRLANDLNSWDHGYIVVVATHDEPTGNRLLGGLPAAINRCGGSTAKFQASWPYRSAYLLIGIPNMGEGNAIEMRSPLGDHPLAWVETGALIIGGMLH